MALYQWNNSYGDGEISPEDMARMSQLAQMFGAGAGYSGWQDKALGQEIGQQAGTLWKQVDPNQYRTGVDWSPELQNAVNSSMVQVDGKWFMPAQLEQKILETSTHMAGHPEGGLSKFMRGLTTAGLLGGIGAGVGAAFGAGGAAGGSGWNSAIGLDGPLGDSFANQPWWNSAGGTVPASYTNGQWLADAGGVVTDANAVNAGSIGGDGMDGWDFLGTNEAGSLGADELAGGGSGSWLDSISNSMGVSPTNLLKLLATGGGGILGALAGKNNPTTTLQTDVPEWLKPYYTGGLDAGLTQLKNSQQLTPGENSAIYQMLQKLNAPNAGLDAANKAMTDTASGKYLDLANNPQWQENMRQLGQNYNEVIRPGTDASFSRAGAMGIGNSAWEEMTARNNRALATGQGAATASAWGQERNNQMNAAGAMPGFQNQYLTGLGNSALQLGNYQRSQPWQGILNYGQLLGNLKGPSNSTQTSNANPWQTAAGGAITGYSLANLWK